MENDSMIHFIFYVFERSEEAKDEKNPELVYKELSLIISNRSVQQADSLFPNPCETPVGLLSI
jgi:hypothetical protein